MPITSKTYQPPAEPSKSAIGAMVDSILNAPGSEFGPSPLAMPGMVYQKAGASSLRRLLSDQITKVFPSASRTEMSSVKEFWPRSVPLLRTSLDRLRGAVTGKAITLVGYRTEAIGGSVPGRGMFYAVNPTRAKSTSPLGKLSVRKSLRGERRGAAFESSSYSRSVRVIKLKNPKVIEGSSDPLTFETPQVVAIRDFVKNYDLPKSLREAGAILHDAYVDRGLYKNFDYPRFYLKADKWISRVAKSKGYDGLIYKSTGEVVDLVGTVGRR